MKRGDGGMTMRSREYELSMIARERRRAALAKGRATRASHKKTKQERQAERDEIAAYLARVPPQGY